MTFKNLIIFYPSFERGGVEEIIKNLIIFNKTKRKKIFLITNKSTNTKVLKNIKNLNILETNIKKNLFLPFRIWSSLICSLKLKSLLNNLDKKNTIVHSMQSNIFSIIISKISGFKIVIRNSENPISSIKFSENKIISYLIFLLRFIFYNMSDKIITNSEGSAKSLELFMFGKNKKKIKHIYNPYLSIKKIKMGESRYNKKKIILGVGRLTIQKNFQNLVHSFYKSDLYKKNYKLIIIGDGIEKKNLNNQINSLKMKKYILLKGYQKNLINFYKKSKLFVLPSKYEGLGNVLIDALNFNVPCIATDCKSGPEEILCFGKGGIIIPSDNIEALTEALKKSIKNYEIMKKKMKFAKKKLNRFHILSQSELYFKELDII